MRVGEHPRWVVNVHIQLNGVTVLLRANRDMRCSSTGVGSHVEGVPRPARISRNRLVTEFKTMNNGHVAAEIISAAAIVVPNVNRDVTRYAPIWVLLFVRPRQNFVNEPAPGPPVVVLAVLNVSAVANQ